MPDRALIAEKTFTFADQQAFAEMVGDYNPMHVDPIFARRLTFGRPVVHGMYLVLWALDSCSEINATPGEIEVQFLHAVRVDDRVACQQTGSSPAKLQLLVNARIVAKITAKPSSAAVPAIAAVPKRRPVRPACRELGAEQLAGASGSFKLSVDPADMEHIAPRFGRVAPDLAAILASTSRLVGMECPGLHSIYSSLRLTCSETVDEAANQLDWRVTGFDPRFSKTDIVATAAGADIRISAFLRPVPQQQPSFADLKSKVRPGAYGGRRALVIGGSRGLGELCAKLLGAGGADVCITYNVGADDADRNARDVAQGGGSIRTLKYDVLGGPGDDEVAFIDGWQPTHVYYFATPAIFVSTRRFSNELFARFCDFYVHGFVDAVRLARKASPKLSVFYPSTVAVSETIVELAEYAAAKAAGEVVCRHLAAADRNLEILIEALPRLPTDQTASLFPVEAADPVLLMISILDRQ